MLPRPFQSLRVRLIASVVLIEVTMLSLLVWTNMTLIQQAHTDRLRDTATSMLQQISTTSGSYLVEVDYASLEEYLRNIATHPELNYVVVLDRDQRPVVRIGDTPTPPWPDSERHPAEVTDQVLDMAADIVFGGRTMGRVLMGFSLGHMQAAIHAARVRSIAIAGTEIVLTILATILIGVHLTRRLGRLAAAAQAVGAGDYDVSVPTEVQDEVGMTAAAFNRMVTDVSQRTRRLQEALARERVIEETSIDGMITYDRNCRILSANPAMQTLFGYQPQALLGQPATTLLADAGDATDPDGREPWTSASFRRLEVSGRRADGSLFPVELYVGCVDIAGQPLYAATLHDVTERKRAENECHTLLEGNRFLIHKSLAVQEEERRHLARELHDELGQCTTAIQADATLIRDLAAGQDTQVATSARAILDVSSRMYEVVHAMMRRLRPTVLDELGLVAAIQEEIGHWQARHPEIRCEFTNTGDLSGLGEAINITLYRIIQEGLTNVAKHAAARCVRVALARAHDTGSAASDAVRLTIEDDGRGMAAGQDTHRGLGLIGIRERVEALRGRLQIETAPGAGTCLRISIPTPIGATT